MAAGQKCPADEACFTQFKFEKFPLPHSHSGSNSRTSDFSGAEEYATKKQKARGPTDLFAKIKRGSGP